MKIYVSDNKKLLKAVSSALSLNYNFDDFQVVDRDAMFLHIKPNNYRICHGSEGHSLFSFTHAGKEVSFSFIPKDRDREEFALSILNDPQSTIVNCCEMTPAGQLSFYLLKQLITVNDRSQRLWVDALDPQLIRNGLASLSLDIDYDHLAYPVLMEHIIDDMVSRISKESVGVPLTSKQAYIINLLEQNDEEMELYNEKKYFLVRAIMDIGFKGSLTRFKGSDRFFSEKDVMEAANVIQGDDLFVSKYNSDEKSHAAPYLANTYDVISYGVKRFGVDNNVVKELLESLYSKGHITNYETRSRMFPVDFSLVDEVHVLGAIRNLGTFRRTIDYIRKQPVDEKMFEPYVARSNQSVYGIRPTTKVPNLYLLSEQEILVYKFIVDLYLGIFCGSEVTRTLKISYSSSVQYQVNVDEVLPLKYGYTVIGLFMRDEELECEDILQKESENRELTVEHVTFGKVTDVEIKDSSTRNPKRLTMQDILRLSEFAGRKRVANSMKERLKDKSIGSVVDNEWAIYDLEKRGVVSIDGDNGTVSLIEAFRDQLRTGVIPSNKAINDVFSAIASTGSDNMSIPSAYSYSRRMIKESINHIRYYEKNPSYTSYVKVLKYCTCPFCDSPLSEMRYTLNCTYCDFKVYKEVKGRRLSTIEMIKLLNHRKSPLIVGMKFKNNDNGQAYLVIGDDKKTTFDFKNVSSSSSKG